MSDDARKQTIPNKRPSCAAPLTESIPEELLSRRQWVVWRYEQNRNRKKPTKVPYNALTGKGADTTDPSTWCSFEEALDAYRNGKGKYSGIGFVLGNGIAGVDLDHCIDPQTKKIAAWAIEIITTLDTYTEISPSEEGVKLFCKNDGPPVEGINRRNWKGNEIELYNSGRYFTVTGNYLSGTSKTIEERSKEFSSLYCRVVNDTGGTRKKKQGKQKAEPYNTPSPSDDELILRILASHDSERFEDLFTGGNHQYKSDSEADWAFVGILCRWTKDDEQIARIWRMCGRDREKLERQDYINRTIAKMRRKLEDEKTESLTHREKIIYKMFAEWNLNDEVFRTYLAARSIANGRRVFKMSGQALAAWLRNAEGGDPEIEKSFGSRRIRQLRDAVKPIYKIFRLKERGGGLDNEGNPLPASKYEINETPFEEAEQEAERLLPEFFEETQKEFAPELAQKIAEHRAIEQAAINIARKYKPSQNTEERVEDIDPIAKLYKRENRAKEQIFNGTDRIVEVWQDMNLARGEVTVYKTQLIEEIDSRLQAGFDPEFRRKKRSKRKVTNNKTTSPKKSNVSPNTDDDLGGVTGSV